LNPALRTDVQGDRGGGREGRPWPVVNAGDGAFLSPQTGNQHIYQPVGKPDPAAPPKKPPRPGAPGHLGSLASLSSPGDSYNEGVKPWRLQPQEISPPPTANLDRSNDRVY